MMMQSGPRNGKNSTGPCTGNRKVLLFHGPDVFDEGHAVRLMDAFPDFGYYQAGTMGRTAAHDHGLETIRSIPEMPGKVIRESLPYDVLLLVICPKTKESGMSFSRIIVDHAGTRKPILHVDCRHGIFTVWNLGMPQFVIETLRGMGFSEEPPIRPAVLVSQDGMEVSRHLQACEPGEYVLCDNILIGVATDTRVSITTSGGRIVATDGIDVKEHGLEKIGDIDISHAKCCSTRRLRGENTPPRITPLAGSGVAFINHAGADVYDLSRGCEGAVVVGDDTSRIVGDILFRFSLPVVAIIDGDWDHLVTWERFAPGSLVLTVDKDDEVGAFIYKTVFRHRMLCMQPFEVVRDAVLEACKGRILTQKAY
jgi:hypothetical protein